MKTLVPRFGFFLGEHSALSVRYALAQSLKKARQELEMLRLAKERELKSWEKCMLPVLLQQADKETLIENIDPWITLVSNIEGTLDDLEQAWAVFEKEEQEWHEKLVAARKAAREKENG